MKVSKKKKLGIVIMILCLLAGTAGTLAYLTDQDQKQNTFTIGEVRCSLQEPHWDQEQARNIVPIQTIQKDPCVKNIGRNDEYVYLRVFIPIEKVRSKISPVEAIPQEMFTYQQNGKWTELEDAKEQVQLDDGKEYQMHVYAYYKELKHDDVTVPLFTEVTAIDFYENQIEKKSLIIPVQALAIQTVNTGTGNTTRKKAISAYQTYMNQQNEEAFPSVKNQE